MRSRIYLVDAHAFLHRAYHALPPFTGPHGEPVGALFGFARMLLMILRREKPDRIAVCFDAPGPTFRHKAYKDYKATRKDIDPDLIDQIKRAQPMVAGLGLPCAILPGYEADDLMATLAKKAVKKGMEAVLVTGDKDALQLVGGGIRVLKDAATGAWMDAPQIAERFGVEPQQIVDYLSIVGDSSDNVPGVKGVGPVGAAKLLKEFGTLEKAIAAAKAGHQSIAPKVAQALIACEKEALAAKGLITLATDAPITLDPDDCRVPEHLESAKPIFEQFGFTSLLKELGANGAVAERENKPSATGVAVGEEVVAPGVSETPFSRIAKELLSSRVIAVCSIRSEGDLADPSKAHLAVGLPDGRVSLFDQKQAQTERAALAKILTGKALKSGWGMKETLAGLETLGQELEGPLFDPMIAAYCLSPARPKAVAFGEGDWKGPLLERASRSLDPKALREKLSAAGVLKLFEEIEMPLLPVLRGMERDGILVDATYLKKLGAEFEEELASLQSQIDTLAGAPLNANSPKQLGELLYDKLGLPVLHKTAKGGRSTDEESLRFLSAQHPLPAKVLEYRELSKLRGTYVEGLLAHIGEDGRVHTTFDQTGAETGRLSSVDPNLQNIPIRSAAGQRIRRAFVAPKGMALVSADYSQIDLRVLAHVSGDKVLIESFKKGEDIHTRTASEVFHVPPQQVDEEMRRRAKAVNFGIVYGQTAFGLSAQLGIPQKDASQIIKKYFERLPRVSRWIEENLEEARKTGVARTFLGRVRQIPELAAKNTALRQFGERAARNTPIQGGSADIIKVAMLKVHAGLHKFKARMLLQIHDELLFELPAGQVKVFAPWVKKEMEHAVKLSVPLQVDVKAGANWQDMEDLA